MNFKRGQLTIFVIFILLFLILLFGYYFYNTNYSNKGDTSFSSNDELDVIRQELLSCFDGIYSDSLDLVGAQGGYFNEPNVPIEVVGNSLFVPYFILNDSFYFPTLDMIKLEILSAVNFSIDSCFQTISLYHPDIDFSFTQQNTSVLINKESVDFITSVNVLIKKEDVVYSFELSEKRSINSKLKSMYDLADYYVFSNILDNGFIPVDGLGNQAKKNELFVSINGFGNNSLIISIYDNLGEFHPQSFHFLDGARKTGNLSVDDFNYYNSSENDEILENFDLEELI